LTLNNFVSLPDSRFKFAVLGALGLAFCVAVPAPLARAAQLTNDAKSAIPHDVQQVIVVDYRAMQNSSAAMSLKDRVMPPELKKLETALVTSGLKVDQDADALAFAAFRVTSPDGKGPDVDRIVGIAQGQFRTREIMANFTKNKVKVTTRRNNSIYPMGATGLDVVFLNQTTMVFGDKDSINAALDARDGMVPNFMTSELANEMGSVESHAVWSLLDAKGTQTMMKSADRRLRHGEEPDEGFALYDGFREWREVRHGGEYVGYDDGCDLRDSDEGRTAASQAAGNAARKGGSRQHVH
jgi:hypothetical protein